ncbi:Choloylglycine hydrolase/NAAA C-terminal [Phytophthora cactorum]|nr:Choloylglycine hydrolase/NAAA C-terminal [Phytophthora cactorum]
MVADFTDFQISSEFAEVMDKLMQSNVRFNRIQALDMDLHSKIAADGRLTTLSIEGPRMQLDENEILRSCLNLEELTLCGRLADVKLDFREYRANKEPIPTLNCHWDNLRALSMDISDAANPLTKMVGRLRVRLDNRFGHWNSGSFNPDTFAGDVNALVNMLATIVDDKVTKWIGYIVSAYKATTSHTSGSSTMASLRLRSSNSAASPVPASPQPYIGVSTPNNSPSEGSVKADIPAPIEAPRLTLEWQSLQLQVTVQNAQTKQPDQKTILESMSGVARPGELLVVMGPSGAGKSSLLDCISGRNNAIKGHVTVNRNPWSKKLKRFAAYVMQEDLFHATLTVREHLVLQARLRMSGSFSRQQYLGRVDTLLEEFGLSKSKNTLIGGWMQRGISGGERKRLALATELLTNPSVLFADEPTSGLDSFMAKSVVQQLRRLAVHEGRTVVATIHQPSSEVYALFDQLELLADGATIYQGKAVDVVDYFAGCGYQCPPFMNPADYFMEKIVVVDADTDQAGVERVRTLKEAWKTHAAQWNNGIEVVNPQHVNGPRTSKAIAATPDESLDFEDSRASVWGQIRVLATRNALRLLRDKTALRLQSVQTLVTTLLVGIIFFQLTLDQQGVANYSGAFFYIVTEQVYGASMPAIMSVPMELPIVYREYDIGLYSVASWYAAKNLCELPQQVILPIISLLPLYFLVGIGHDFSMYIQMQLVLILLHSSCVAFGYCISCVCRRIDIAPLAGNIVLMPLLLLGGLFIDPSDVPGVLRWVQYITPFRYGLAPAPPLQYQQEMVRLLPAISLLSSSMIIAPVVSHEAYATKVPNGRNVDGVKAIGHTNVDGGGIRNAFGRAFYDAGHAWTKELCEADSDRDGQTNGEELGDPCCEWTVESAKDPLWTSGVSNPGDDASTSNETSWPAYECSSTATSANSSQAGSASTSSSVNDSSTSTSTASASWSGVTVSAMVGLLTFLIALAAYYHPTPKNTMLKLTKSAAVLSLLSASVFENVNGYPKYVARLPNGENVKGVAALGHVNVAGGGDRNEFGENFEQRGELWTKELCEADSDGDGQTNGQELGDPAASGTQQLRSVISGRSMDFEADLDTALEVIPRNTHFQELPVSGCPDCPDFEWQNKLGFVAANVYGVNVAADGLNEAGLSAAWLYLDATEYPNPENGIGNFNESKPVVTSICSYILGNFATVDEVKKGLEQVQLAGINGEVAQKLLHVPVPADGKAHSAPLHVSVHDHNGNNLVIEFLQGNPIFHDNPNGVLTNDPPLEEQLTLLNKHLSELRELSTLETYDRGTASGVGCSTFTEYGGAATDGRATQWSIVRDHKRRMLYIRSTANQLLRRVSLDMLDWADPHARRLIPVHTTQDPGKLNTYFKESATMEKVNDQVQFLAATSQMQQANEMETLSPVWVFVVGSVAGGMLTALLSVGWKMIITDCLRRQNGYQKIADI